jgi:hypothetical protein
MQTCGFCGGLFEAATMDRPALAFGPRAGVRAHPPLGARRSLVRSRDSKRQSRPNPWRRVANRTSGRALSQKALVRISAASSSCSLLSSPTGTRRPLAAARLLSPFGYRAAGERFGDAGVVRPGPPPARRRLLLLPELSSAHRGASLQPDDCLAPKSSCLAVSAWVAACRAKGSLDSCHRAQGGASAAGMDAS